jgi:hypothetical protein
VRRQEHEGIVSHWLNDHILRTTLVILGVLVSFLMIYYVLID